MTRTLLAALLLPVALQAQTTPAGPISKGSKIVGGSASVAVTDQDNSNAITSVSVSPEVLYFMKDRFALGGRLGLGYTSADNFTSSSWAVGPAVKYYFGALDARTLPYLGANASFGRAKSSSGASDLEQTTTTLEGTGGITWLLVRHVGLNGELFFRRTGFESSGGTLPTPTTITQTAFGLRFGISAFLF